MTPDKPLDDAALDALVARYTRRQAVTDGYPQIADPIGDDDVLAVIDEVRRLRGDAAFVQKAVDQVVHYRNLAIVLGAKPDQMLTDAARKLCEAGTADWPATDFSEPETWEEVDRLRAENADLRAAACTCDEPLPDDCADQRPVGHAAGCPAVERTRMREERDGFRDTYHAERARADRYAAALAHIESLGHHHATCIVHGGIPANEWRCDPACPTATAKRAREET